MFYLAKERESKPPGEARGGSPSRKVDALVLSRRKYAWYKDGQRLPVHEDKYTQTDSRGELRVKGADTGDSGMYTCASLTANPQGMGSVSERSSQVD